MSRVALSNTGSWKLKHESQDIRGYRVLDASGAHVGTVDEMIVNTEQRRVDTIVLEDGREIPAADIRIGDNVVYLDAAAASTGGGTVSVYDDGEVVEREPVGHGDYAAHAEAFRRHHGETYASTGRDYAYYEPAYRYGFEAAHREEYRDRGYLDAEAQIRDGYLIEYPDYDYDEVSGAVRYGYSTARRGR